MPRPDIQDQINEQRAKRRKRKPSAPPVYERPAPAQRHTPGKTPTSGGGYRLPPLVAPPPQFRDDITRAKVAAHKHLLVPLDPKVIARQAAMRDAGLPVTVDGHWGDRSRFNWAQAADAKRALGSQIEGLGARRDPFAKPGQKGARIGWHDPLVLAQIDRMKHTYLAKDARRLAIAAGVRGARRGSLGDALAKSVVQNRMDAEARRVMDNVNQVRPGTFTGQGSDQLELARAAAHGVKPAGLGALSGDELLWLWNQDGISIRRQFTTVVQTKEGPKNLPGKELVKGMQGYANRHGEHVRETGELDTPTYDAFLRAARNEQRQREQKVLHEARTYYFQGDAFNRASQAVGSPMSFEAAWKAAGSGGSDPASVDATHILIAASQLAERNAIEVDYQQRRQRAYDQAAFGLSGTNPWVRDDDLEALGDQKSAFAGTPYGVFPGTDSAPSGGGRGASPGPREQSPGDALRTPAWLAMASGVPDIYALAHSYDAAEELRRIMQLQELNLQRRFQGTDASHHLVYHTTKVQTLQRNPDGSVKFQVKQGPLGGVTRVPMYETATLVNADPELVHDSLAMQVAKTGLGWASAIPDTGKKGFSSLYAGFVILRQSEYLAQRSLRSGLVSGHTYYPDQHGLGAYGLAPITVGQAYDQAEFEYDQLPFVASFVIGSIFDPLNFAGVFMRGGVIFAKAAKAFGRAEEVENSFLRGLQLTVKAVDDPLTTAAGTVQRSASRFIHAESSGPVLRFVRGQALSVKTAREAATQRMAELRAMGYKGAKVPKAKFERYMKAEQQLVEALYGHAAIGPYLHALGERRADLFIDAAQTQLSESGEALARLLMRLSEPGQLGMLRHLNPAEFRNGMIGLDSVALVRAGASFGRKGSFINAGVAQAQGRMRATVMDQLQVASRHLRTSGDYTFAEHESWRLADGVTPVSYYPEADPAGLVSEIAPGLDEVFRELDGALMQVANPGFGQVVSDAEMRAYMAYASQRRAEPRVAAWRAEMRRQGVLPDAKRAEAQLRSYEEEELRELEDAFVLQSALTDEEVALVEREMAEQVAAKERDVAASRSSVEAARRGLRNLRRVQAQALLEMAQGSGHLQQAARRLAPRQGLDLAAVEDAAVGELTQQQADERVQSTVRKMLHTYLGESYDVSSVAGLLDDEARLAELRGVIRQARPAGEPELIPDSNLDWYQDVMPGESKLQERQLRGVFAKMFVGDLQREGLFGDATELRTLEKQIAAGAGRGTDLLDLVRSMPWKHSTVLTAQSELDRAVARRNLVLEHYQGAIARGATSAEVWQLKDELHEAHAHELFAEDQVYSRVLALTSRPNMEQVLDRARQSYAWLVQKPFPSDEERALRWARRMQIRKLEGYLTETAQTQAKREVGSARRALVRQDRLIGDAETELRRLEKLHEEQLRGAAMLHARPSPKVGLGGWIDTRQTIEIRHNPQRASLADRMAVVGNHHDLLQYTLTDPNLMALGGRQANVPTQVRKARVNLRDASLYQSHLWVNLDDFKAGTFVGKVHGAHSTDPEGAFVHGEEPDYGSNVAYLTELNDNELFDLLSSGRVNPGEILRHGPARQFALDQAEPHQAVTRGASGMVTTKQRGALPPQLSGDVRRAFDDQLEGLPAPLTNSVREAYALHILKGKRLEQFDYGIIEQLAKANPRYAERIHAAARERLNTVWRIEREQAAQDMDKSVRSAVMRSQGRYAQAWARSEQTGARMLWAPIEAANATWRAAVTIGSPQYHVMNHIGDLTRAVIIGGISPQELVVEHLGVAENVLYDLVKAAPTLLYKAAGHFDHQYATGMQRALRDLFRFLEGAHLSVRKSFFEVQDMPFPEHLMEMAESRTLTGYSNRDDLLGDDDPTNFREPFQRYQESVRQRKGAGIGDAESTAFGDILELRRASFRVLWHVTGERPDLWRRRAVWRSSYLSEMRRQARAHPEYTVEQLEELGTAHAIKMVEQSLFDYDEIPVFLENLRPLIPFSTFTYKMAKTSVIMAKRHPWLFPAVYRLENRKDPVTGEPDPLGVYLDVTWLVDPIFRALGLDHYAPKGVGFDPTQLLDFTKTYKAFRGPPNPHLPEDAGGRDFINSVLGYFNMGGLGLNPYLMAGLQTTDLAGTQSWRAFFPQDSMMEALTRSDWFPDGLNLERMAEDLAYPTFHNGKTLTDLRHDDLVYMANIEVSRQAAAGLPPDYDKAMVDVVGFLQAAAVFSIMSGLWVRRLNPADHELLKIQQQASEDYSGLSPHQLALNAIYRQRYESEETMRRAIEIYPLVEAYYKLTSYSARQRMMDDHPEIAAYVQGQKLRQSFTDGTVEAATQTRRDRDRILNLQAAAVSRMYKFWRDGPKWDYQVRSHFYDTLMTPELRDYFERHKTPQSEADAFVTGEFYRYMSKVSDAFHDLPEKDFEAKQKFMERNPWLSDYWQITGQERKDAKNLLNGINASYRSWYFTVVDTHGFEAAAEILQAHPTMFEGTSSAGKVDRYTGQWLPKDAASISEHAADYLKVKGLLDSYFSLPKGQARLDYAAAHPSLTTYFKKYGADRHFRRRFRSLGGSHRFGHAAATSPFLAKRVDFWKHFFSLMPDKRLKFIEQHANDSHIFAWGPTADSIFTDQAHGFAWGKTARRDAYLRVAPLLQLYFELKVADRAFFLKMNPEVQQYFDQYSTSSPTGDKKLDAALERFFKIENPEEKDAFLEAHPGLQKFFDSKRTTPEEKALGAMLDAYFKLPKGGARKMYLLRHPELQGFFDKRKDERDLEDSWTMGLVDADPRVIAFQKTLAYEQALDEVRIHRESLNASKRTGKSTKITPVGRRRPDPALVRDVRLPGD